MFEVFVVSSLKLLLGYRRAAVSTCGGFVWVFLDSKAEASARTECSLCGILNEILGNE